jgi:hypothetical protein
MKKFLLIISLLLLGLYTYSQTKYISIKSGKWDDSSIWSPQGVPGQNDTAIIATGDNVSIDPGFFGSTYKIAKLFVQDSAKLSIYNGTNFWGLLNLTYVHVYDTLKVDGAIEGDINSSYPVQMSIYKSLTGKGIVKFIGLHYSAANITIEPDANLTFYYSVMRIEDNDTVRNYGHLFTDYHIIGSNSASTWINKANSYLSVGDYILNTGTLICNETGNTIKYAPINGDINIKIPKDTVYYNLYIEGSDTTFLNSPKIYINNDFSILGSTFNAQTNDMYVRGNWSDDGQFKCDNCTVYFDGSSDQTIKAAAYETFENLVLDNAPNKIVQASDIVVNDTLTLNTIDEANNKFITIGKDSNNIGDIVYQSGKIIGTVKRWVKSSSNIFLFPIGTSSFYTFVKAKFPSVANAGIISFKFIDTIPGSNGLPLKDGTGDTAVNPFNDGFWVADTLDGFDLGNNTYDISLQGKTFKAFTINDSTKIIVRPHSDSTWRFNGIQGKNDAANYYVSRNSLSYFSLQYAFADTTHCTAPVLTAINGPADVCKGDQNVVYTTDTSSTNIYSWTVDGGTINSNNGDTISINWDDQGQYASISVNARNSCTFGNTIHKQVRVHSIPAEIATGPKAVAEGSDSVLYYISTPADYSHTGYVGGNAVIDSITPTQDSAWISFPKAGTDTIYTISQYNGGCAADTTAFTVYVYNVINSVQSGDWFDPKTWDCDCQPQLSDNVRINPGHTVVLNKYTDYKRGITYYHYDINNIILEKNAVLSESDGISLSIYGDVFNNGVVDYHYDNLELHGTSKSIDGLGEFDVDTLELLGSRNISSNANLYFNGSIKLNNNLLNNKGKIIIQKDVKSDASGTFVNGYYATTSIKGNFMDNEGELIADSTENTITYTGDGQTVKPVSTSSDGYYNLIIDGNGKKTAISDLNILGNFEIIDTGSLDINNHNMTLYKDWLDASYASDPFIEGTSLVLFNASGDQYIYADKGETFYDLKVGQNSTLHLLPKQHFTVSNNLYIDGLLKMEMQNPSDTLASFIYKNDIIYGTYGKVETDLLVAPKQWYEISPAITGLNSSTFTKAINNSFNPNFYWYDESVDLDGNPSTEPASPFDDSYLAKGWKYAHNGATGADVPLNLNAGYMFYADRNLNIAMIGKLAKVSVDFDTTLSYTNNDPDGDSDTLPNFYDGWNLVGNPYTAYLNADSVLSNSSNVDNGIYVWDDANGQYAGYQNGFKILSGKLGNLIPPLQAFFVRANAAGATLKIKPSYRTYGQQMFIKAPNAVYSPFKQDAIKLAFNANGKTEFFATYFYYNAKKSFDEKYDFIHLSSSNPLNPQIFSKKNKYNLALYSLPYSKINKALIPIYISTGNSGKFCLSTKYINGLSNQFVLLKDLKTNIIYNLRKYKNIHFNYDSNDSSHRFDLLIVKNHRPKILKQLKEIIAYEDSTVNIQLSNYFIDNDEFDSLSFSVTDNKADLSWLKIVNGKLTGTPKQQDIGTYFFTIKATDLLGKNVEQKVKMIVFNTNDAPVVTQKLKNITVFVGEKIIYSLPDSLFVDDDPDDNLTISCKNLPNFLKFDRISGTFTGCASTNDIGTYKIILTASDNSNASASTSFVMTVKSNDSLADELRLYPNPASDNVFVNINSQIYENSEIRIYNTNGNLCKIVRMNSNQEKINISDLPKGDYLLEIVNGKNILSTKLSKK